MFEHAMNIVKENITRLNASGASEAEVYLGVSNICENLKDFLATTGWNAHYIEQGFYLLCKD